MSPMRTINPSEDDHRTPRSVMNIILAIRNNGPNELGAIDKEIEELESRKKVLMHKKKVLQEVMNIVEGYHE
jgi:hypothetical protein